MDTGSTRTPTWDVFVSHATAQQAVAQRLSDALERCGLRAFVASKHISARVGSARWSQLIDDALDASCAVILLVTPAALASRWVEYEWRGAHEDILAGADIALLPVCLEGPSPAELPRGLRRHQVTDLRRAGSADEQVEQLVQLASHRVRTAWHWNHLAPLAVGTCGDGSISAETVRYAQLLQDALRQVQPSLSPRQALALAARLSRPAATLAEQRVAPTAPLSHFELARWFGAAEGRDRGVVAATDALTASGLAQRHGRDALVARWPLLSSVLSIRHGARWRRVEEGDVPTVRRSDMLRITLRSPLPVGQLFGYVVCHDADGTSVRTELVDEPEVSTRPRNQVTRIELDFELAVAAGCPPPCLVQVVLLLKLKTSRGTRARLRVIVDQGQRLATLHAAALEQQRAWIRRHCGDGWLVEHLLSHTEQKGGEVEHAICEEHHRLDITP